MFHPNCQHTLIPWEAEGEEEYERMKERSNRPLNLPLQYNNFSNIMGLIDDFTNKVLDALQIFYGIIGAFPFVGVGADLFNTILSLARGNNEGAAWSVANMLFPIAAEKIIGKIAQAAGKVAGKTLSGKWIKVNESMNDASRAYQKQITGREGEAFLQNGVKFDGVNNGTLIEVKGNYKNFVNKNTGEFYDWFNKGKDSLIDQASRQIRASGGAQINWYFSDEVSMNAAKILFQSQGIKGINFIFEAIK